MNHIDIIYLNKTKLLRYKHTKVREKIQVLKKSNSSMCSNLKMPFLISGKLYLRVRKNS